MAITVVGSIAFDTVATPFGRRERMAGGAATHFALATSFFDEVRVVGPIGDDFDESAHAARDQHAEGRRCSWPTSGPRCPVIAPCSPAGTGDQERPL